VPQQRRGFIPDRTGPAFVQFAQNGFAPGQELVERNAGLLCHRWQDGTTKNSRQN
jgi:hypothetical protein